MGETTTIVTGSKGGVGTTTVALNLGVQLAMQTRKRVVLLDLAQPFGQISVMLDLNPCFTILDALERIARLDELLLATLAARHKTGIEILAGPRHAPVKPEQRQSVTIQSLKRLVEIAGCAYDFVVVDMGVVNAAECAPVLAGAGNTLLVAEPSVLALGMIERHMAAAAAAGLDCERIHIVINRWQQSDSKALAAFQEKHGRAILMRLPNDYRQVTEGVRLGMPLAESADNSLLGRYRDLAAWVAGEVPGEISRREDAGKTVAQ